MMQTANWKLLLLKGWNYHHQSSL